MKLIFLLSLGLGPLIAFGMQVLNDNKPCRAELVVAVDNSNRFQFPQIDRPIATARTKKLYDSRSTLGRPDFVFATIFTTPAWARERSVPPRIRVMVSLYSRDDHDVRSENPVVVHAENERVIATLPEQFKESQRYAMNLQAPVMRYLSVSVNNPDVIRIAATEEQKLIQIAKGHAPDILEEKISDRVFLETYFQRRRFMQILRAAAELMGNREIARAERLGPWDAANASIDLNLSALTHAEMDSVINLVITELQTRSLRQQKL